MMLEIGVCKVKARKKYEAFVIDAGDVTTEHRGKLNWQRDVNDIITSKYEERLTESCLARLTACRDSGQVIHHISMIQIIFHLR